MAELTVELGERSYPIFIDTNLFSSLGIASHINTSRVVIITNDTVGPLYVEQVCAALEGRPYQIITIEDGEAFKTLATFEYVISELLKQHASRDTTLIALGGGVVGDLCGFVAACYQRGIPFIQIPTTLLAQVDSSVGGKTAVNHPLGKNMIGAFYQPEAVFINISTLTTLPKREFAAGMAEVVKYGIIYDAGFFSWLEQNQSLLLAQDAATLQYAIHQCCKIKAEVVAKDERESGIRAILNLGHTFGHAIEAHMGFGTWLHGEAVAAGTVLAAKTAEAKGWLMPSETRRIIALLQAFSLPVSAPKEMDLSHFLQHMQHDKKVQAGKIRFVLPFGIGQARVTDEVSEDILRNVIDETN